VQSGVRGYAEAAGAAGGAATCSLAMPDPEVLADDGSPQRGGAAASPPRGIEPRPPLALVPAGGPSRRVETAVECQRTTCSGRVPSSRPWARTRRRPVEAGAGSPGAELTSPRLTSRSSKNCGYRGEIRAHVGLGLRLPRRRKSHLPTWEEDCEGTGISPPLLCQEGLPVHECWVCDAILRPPSVQIWSTRPVQRQMRSLRSRGAHAMQMHGAWVGSLGRGQGSPNPSRCPRDPGRRAICVEQAHREGGFLGVLRGRHASFWLKFPVEPHLGLTRTV